MPSKLRRLSSREVLRALGSFGFEVIRTRGSHAKLSRTLPSGERQTLTIPVHKTLSPGTLRAIFRQASRFVPEAALRRRFFTD
jgi:predicted RNA binding protein YcfA (HicA-like mRNA interferase family)